MLTDDVSVDQVMEDKDFLENIKIDEQVLYFHYSNPLSYPLSEIPFGDSAFDYLDQYF